MLPGLTEPGLELDAVGVEESEVARGCVPLIDSTFEDVPNRVGRYRRSV